jgi:hypothetical protein
LSTKGPAKSPAIACSCRFAFGGSGLVGLTLVDSPLRSEKLRGSSRAGAAGRRGSSGATMVNAAPHRVRPRVPNEW